MTGRDLPPEFWAHLSRARRPLLGLDYDGTLAPFKVERMAAVPADGVVQALRAIIDQGDTQVCVISGRRVDEVVQLLGDLGVTMVGSHGYEHRHPDGSVEQIPLTSLQDSGLALAEQQVEALGLGPRLERKAASLAFHTRGLDTPEARRLQQRVQRLFSAATGEGLTCKAFNGGVELRATGIDKGTVLAGLLGRHQPDFAVYIGDDDTDEDAFAALAASDGVGIKVGDGDTAAAARLPSCAAVVEFLLKWLATINRATGTHSRA